MTYDRNNGPYMLFGYTPSVHLGYLYDYNSYYYSSEPYILHPTSKIYKHHARAFTSFLKKMGCLIKIGDKGPLYYLCGWDYIEQVFNGDLLLAAPADWKDELRMKMEEAIANRKLKTE